MYKNEVFRKIFGPMAEAGGKFRILCMSYQSHENIYCTM